MLFVPSGGFERATPIRAFTDHSLLQRDPTNSRAVWQAASTPLRSDGAQRLPCLFSMRFSSTAQLWGQITAATLSACRPALFIFCVFHFTFLHFCDRYKRIRQSTVRQLSAYWRYVIQNNVLSGFHANAPQQYSIYDAFKQRSLR